MAEIRVEIPAGMLASISAKLSPDLYLPAIATLLQQAALLGEREARGLVPKDTSALARSLIGEVTGPLTARVYSPLAYAVVMDQGRAAGATMPPPDALLGWMSRHGIPASARFVIARGIGRRGIRGRFFMKAAMQAVTETLPRLAESAVATIAARWSA